MDPLNFSEERFRPSLEERLESIISGAALMADSSCTRDDRRERIVAECNSVRQALQDLLSEYMGNVSTLFYNSALSCLLVFLNSFTFTVFLSFKFLCWIVSFFFHLVARPSCFVRCDYVPDSNPGVLVTVCNSSI